MLERNPNWREPFYESRFWEKPEVDKHLILLYRNDLYMVLFIARD